MRAAARARLVVVVSALVAGGATLLAGPTLAGGAAGPLGATAPVEPLVLEQLATGDRADFLVWLAPRANLEPAPTMGSKEARVRFVLSKLRRTADDSQRGLRELLARRRAEHQPFYISNTVLVLAGSEALLDEIVARPEVVRVTANHLLGASALQQRPDGSSEARGVEPNLLFVAAPAAWALGATGAGIVIAVNDTGLDEDHPAIARHYRGCVNPPACTVKDHDHAWWDATGTYPLDPHDGNGHGTFCTGVAVGDDGGANQVGMAPDATTIHCKVLTDSGSTTTATVFECFQWNLAPWNLSGADPDPSLAPDVVTLPWGFGGGGQAVFRDAIQALNAAGILVVVAAGGDGPGCGTLRSPGDYREVLTVGATDRGVAYPGAIAPFSSRGPSALDPSPPYDLLDVLAPGTNIRSSLPGGAYDVWSGTAAATAHVSGLVALMWSACPELRGDVGLTDELVKRSATPLAGQLGSSCGGDYVDGPNNDWGHGTIHAEAAVRLALLACGVVFADGFEAGDTSGWSATTP